MCVPRFEPVDASFVLAHGGPFDDGTEIREVWVAGHRHVVSRAPEGVEGSWDVVLTAGGAEFPGTLKLKGTRGSFTAKDEDPEDDDDPDRADLALTYQVRDMDRQAHFDTGTNLFFYASERTRLKSRLPRASEKARLPPLGSSTWTRALLGRSVLHTTVNAVSVRFAK